MGLGLELGLQLGFMFRLIFGFRVRVFIFLLSPTT